MKACVLEKLGQLVYRDVPTPEPKENEVLLQVKACGICSSDLDRVFTTGAYHFPLIPGHEFAGKIVETGRGVDPAYLNRRAAVFPLLPCFHCAACQGGAYARCENYNYFGSRCDGGFGEYIAVPVWNLVLFPDKIPYTTAALCEPASVALHAVSAAPITPHDIVVIIGSGTIGLLAAMWARLRGAKRVVIVGRGKAKTEFARSLGFPDTVSSLETNVEAYLKELSGGAGADVVLELVGSAGSVDTALRLVKKGGQVVLTGNPHGDIGLSRSSYWKILRGELTLKGTWNSSFNSSVNDWQTVMTAFEKKAIQPAPLITHRFPLRECKEAFDRLRKSQEAVVKVMFDME